MLKATKMIFWLLLMTAVGANGVHAEGGIFKPKPLGFGSEVLQEPNFLTVDEAFRFNAVQEGDLLAFEWHIEEGYFLYGERMRFEVDGETLTLGDAEFQQAGEIKDDPYFGETLVHYDYLNGVIRVKASAVGESTIHVTYQGCADAGLCYPPETKQALFIADQSVVDAGAGNGPSSGAASGGSDAGAGAGAGESAVQSLFAVMFFAMLGGLALNLMPCVFPVLSLKALNLAMSGSHSRSEQRMEALAYTAGVLTLFAAIAGTLLVLRAGGESIGWGFQLQSTWFVGLLAYVMFLLGLSLSGLLEVGTRLMGLGDNLANAGGRRGSFFTGALAVIVASPCTAPFMGTALGYAITRPAGEAMAVFLALGFGMALPFLLIAYVPGFARILPKPGAWMETFKQILAFPMYLTALWLVWVLGRQTDVTGMALVLGGMIAIAFAAWLSHHLRNREGFGKRAGQAVALASMAMALVVLGSDQLQQGPSRDTSDGNLVHSGGSYEMFASNKLDDLRKSGETVFVNVTADWCITCLVNEKAVLSQEPIKDLLTSGEVTYLKGDWTNKDANITEYLESFGRNGVPLYVVYHGMDEPVLLPQVLTQNSVMEALKRTN